jgi:hypothetical protein
LWPYPVRRSIWRPPAMATMTWKYRERNRGVTAPIYYSALARLTPSGHCAARSLLRASPGRPSMATRATHPRARRSTRPAAELVELLPRGSFSAGYHGLLQKNPRTCRGIRVEQVQGKNPNTSYIGGYAAHEVPIRSTFFQLLRPSDDKADCRYFISGEYTSYYRKIQWLRGQFSSLLRCFKFVANL